MKSMILSLIVVLSVSSVFAAKPASGPRIRSVEQVAAELKITDLSKLRGEKSTRESRNEIARSASGAISKKLGIDPNTIIKLSSIEGAIELFLHMTELNTPETAASKKLYANLIEMVERTMEPNASSSTNKQVGKLFALLSSGKATAEMVSFAKILDAKIAETQNLKTAMDLAATELLKTLNKDNSDKAVAEWLKKLEECLA